MPGAVCAAIAPGLAVAGQHADGPRRRCAADHPPVDAQLYSADGLLLPGSVTGIEPLWRWLRPARPESPGDPPECRPLIWRSNTSISACQMRAATPRSSSHSAAAVAVVDNSLVGAALPGAGPRPAPRSPNQFVLARPASTRPHVAQRKRRMACSSSISGTPCSRPLSVPSSVLLATSTCRSPDPWGANALLRPCRWGKCAFMTIVPVTGDALRRDQCLEKRPWAAPVPQTPACRPPA